MMKYIIVLAEKSYQQSIMLSPFIIDHHNIVIHEMWHYFAPFLYYCINENLLISNNKLYKG